MEFSQITKVLCTTDFSETGNHAVRYGLGLAKALGAVGEVAYVLESLRHVYLSYEEDMKDEVGDGERDHVENLLENLVEEIGAERAERKILHGDPYKKIIEEAKEGGADLIVMGAHGQTGDSRFSMGNVTTKVIKTAPCPVLTVKLGSRPEIEKILCPVDFSPFSQKALKVASWMKTRLDASLTMAHIVAPAASTHRMGHHRKLAEKLEKEHTELAQFKMTQMMEEANLVNISKEVLLGNPSQEILNLVEKDNFDLVVMGTHGRTGLAHFFLGSVAENLIREAPVPILVCRTTEE